MDFFQCETYLLKKTVAKLRCAVFNCSLFYIYKYKSWFRFENFVYQKALLLLKVYNTVETRFHGDDNVYHRSLEMYPIEVVNDLSVHALQSPIWHPKPLYGIPNTFSQ